MRFKLNESICVKHLLVAAFLEYHYVRVSYSNYEDHQIDKRLVLITCPCKRLWAFVICWDLNGNSYDAMLSLPVLRGLVCVRGQAVSLHLACTV